MNFDKTKFRCSRLGHLMTEPKLKSETISESTKEYLRELYVQIKYGRTKDITSKYLLKGNLIEENSLTLYSRIMKTFYAKNQNLYSDEFIIGTPDIVTDDTIIDIKSSYDIFTFHKSKYSKLNPLYYWQLLGYMSLTGKEKAVLSYCLVNTPDTLIESEKRKLQWSTGIQEEELTAQMLADVEKNCKFDDIPIHERCFTIQIDRNQQDIDRLHERVKLCREWMNENMNG